METRILDDIPARLRAALERDDLSSATAIIETLRPPDQADIFSELDDEVQAALLPELNPADSADILEELDEKEAAELVATLPTHTLIRIVEAMEPAMAILTIVVWANGLGSLLPLLAARLRVDPAIVSGSVMSTLVDATGLFIYFTIARVILGV